MGLSNLVLAMKMLLLVTYSEPVIIFITVIVKVIDPCRCVSSNYVYKLHVKLRIIVTILLISTVKV